MSKRLLGGIIGCKYNTKPLTYTEQRGRIIEGESWNCDSRWGYDLYSVLSNIHTGPTDANAFRGHRLLTTQKGYTYRKEIKGPRKVNTHAIMEKKIAPPRKIRLQIVRRRRRHDKGDDRAHCSHSTREAKQNETNKKNQGSPIKTIKSHDSILVPLLGRGVFTAGFAPARPFPTATYKCGVSYSVLSSDLILKQYQGGFSQT